jgi:hypothetical protein
MNFDQPWAMCLACRQVYHWEHERNRQQEQFHLTAPSMRSGQSYHVSSASTNGDHPCWPHQQL